MKRIAVIILALLMCVGLTACKKVEVAVPIESVTIWEVTVVQSKTTGKVIACGEADSEAYPDVRVIEMVCGAKDAELTVNCTTTDEQAEGFYAKSDSGDVTTYMLRLDGVNAKAYTSYAADDDGELRKTLAIEIDDYILNFSEPQ